ncbi:MAG: hypothetical protein GC151_00865 [Betaproteobacteria bacterium]|nr:hypothetical protein [Betaproteobacteria bacterium]
MGTSFLARTVTDRIAAMAGAGGPTWLDADVRATGVAAAECEIGGRRVVVIGTDPDRSSGAIGREGSRAIIDAISHARANGFPLLLLLDSAGAKLTEGTPVLGACRQIERHLLLAAADGLRIGAVLGRNCFGGASLLAFSAELRIFPRGARLGLSGPRALVAVQPCDLETRSVQSLFGAESRARHDEDAVLVTDDAEAILATVVAWLAEPAPRLRDPDRRFRMLTRRLRMYWGDPFSATTYPPPPEIEVRLDHLFPQGWNAVCCDGVVWGDGWIDGRDTCFAGFLGGRAVSAFGCWQFLEVLREFGHEPAGRPVTFLLDCPGHRADAQNEQLLISEYVAAISQAAHALGSQGRTLELWIVGEAGGAIYVALAAAATTVTAWPGVRLQTLPVTAVNGVVGPQGDQKPTLSALMEARVIDRWTRSTGFGEWPAPRIPPR